MTHRYRLHEDILAECLCCHSQQPFHFDSASDQVVCTFCTRHIGAEKAERRDADHVRLWAELYAEADEAHRVFAAESARRSAENDAALVELQAKVDQLTGIVNGQFDQTATGGVRALLETELLKRAERRTDLESRRTARAMQVLARIAARHGADQQNPLRCRCGNPVVDCRDLAALEPLRQEIADWEARARRP
ncbi:hypothetical protein [Glaciibacter sp. 2TAF33]|uniref:hypothetical protein n=1 Tax=Glaciibacter sp. 2TAF33 TaxID=3233015 RepID=UPI003F90AE4C